VFKPAGRVCEDGHDHHPRRVRRAGVGVQYGSSDRDNGTTCAFTSFEQCMMTATPGTGGSCVQNPWYARYGEPGRGQDGDDRRRPKRK
jgi:hypothetical protein